MHHHQRSLTKQASFNGLGLILRISYKAAPSIHHHLPKSLTE